MTSSLPSQRLLAIVVLADFIAGAGAISICTGDQCAGEAPTSFGETGSTANSLFCERKPHGWQVNKPFFQLSRERYLDNQVRTIAGLIEQLLSFLPLVRGVDYDKPNKQRNFDVERPYWVLDVRPSSAETGPRSRNSTYIQATASIRQTGGNVHSAYIKMVQLSRFYKRARSAQEIDDERDIRFSYNDFREPDHEEYFSMNDKFYTAKNSDPDFVPDGCRVLDPTGISVGLSDCDSNLYCVRCPPFGKKISWDAILQSSSFNEADAIGQVSLVNNVLHKIKLHAMTFSICRDMLADPDAKITPALKSKLEQLLAKIQESRAICQEWAQWAGSRDFPESIPVVGAQLMDCSSL